MGGSQLNSRDLRGWVQAEQPQSSRVGFEPGQPCYVKSPGNGSRWKLRKVSAETESFSAYMERVEMFFIANRIIKNRKAAVFLSVIGAKSFSLLRSLVAPQKPSEKLLVQLREVLKAHFG